MERAFQVEGKVNSEGPRREYSCKIWGTEIRVKDGGRRQQKMKSKGWGSRGQIAGRVLGSL